MTAFACECEQLSTSSTTDEVLLFSASGHVSRRLMWLCGDTEYAGGPGWRLGGADLTDRLSTVASALKPNELTQVQVLPMRDARPAYWQALPLAQWLMRERTGWFPAALGGLKMAFQPIFDLRSGAVFGHEALVRAEAGGHFYGAGELLAAAPAHGGLHVFDRQARQAAIHQGAELTRSGNLLINFMPGVIYDPEVCLNTTFAACRQSSVDPSRLIFEVVETEDFPDLDLLRGVLERYRREGMRVALDDLGAGHSSLLYLEALRPDLVKLDKGLLIGITADDPRVSLVAALIRYAHQLGVQVVAEGLETAAELKLAAALGADLGQGYGLGRPAFERDVATEATSSARIQHLAAPFITLPA